VLISFLLSLRAFTIHVPCFPVLIFFVIFELLKRALHVTRGSVLIVK
jgi:hypothetical protein